ncbi:hypothetical protein AVEN_128995-1 [Araneus ventricosus]|uniref:Uncharacterized protein n=1 Tax=Araneus ventricosus TaxID=182803 RepID=A0A4Y2G963_ARAVE|nr:hypothetical protein AVEN_128995-1 [Araneus ventricosus]
MLVTSLFVKELDVSDLLKLDVIGIKDPIEKLSEKEQEDLTKEHSLQSVRYNDKKRHEDHLTWLDNCAPLPDNLELVIRRLQSTTKKLLHENVYNAYEGIFLEWPHEGIIEEVPVDEINLAGNYLSHKPVLKESSTTPIRPVFDASAPMKGQPSLNESLHIGSNLIELIPDILLLFREKKIGVSADEEIPGSLCEEFVQCFRELKALKKVRIPRWINITPNATKKVFIHTFCDASKFAYAAVSYLAQKGDDENVHFLASRSRIALLKGAKTPRLKLLAALVGSRLTKSIADALSWTTVKCFNWSDSTTVFTLITKEENWSVFVNNRVKEIRKISQPSWYHVSGVENPADLSSSGCKASYFVKT